VALHICVVLGGFGFSRHGELAWIQALTGYPLQQVFWFIVDMGRLRFPRAPAATSQPERGEPASYQAIP
jgi:hypothetical protein